MEAKINFVSKKEILKFVDQNMLKGAKFLKKKKMCSYIERLYCPDIDEDCFEKRFTIKNRLVGEGQFGMVYDACMGNDCRYVAKWIPFVDAEDEDDPLREAYIQNEAFKLGIAPRIYQILYCVEGVIIIMEALPTKLEDIMTDEKISDEKKAQYIKEALNCIDKLHTAGFKHNDAQLQNFMVDAEGNVKLIDFGKADFFIDECREDYEPLFDGINIDIEKLVRKHQRRLQKKYTEEVIENINKNINVEFEDKMKYISAEKDYSTVLEEEKKMQNDIELSLEEAIEEADRKEQERELERIREKKKRERREKKLEEKRERAWQEQLKKEKAWIEQLNKEKERERIEEEKRKIQDTIREFEDSDEEEAREEVKLSENIFERPGTVEYISQLPLLKDVLDREREQQLKDKEMLQSIEENIRKRQKKRAKL